MSASRSVRRKLVSSLDDEVAGARERRERVHAANVRARHETFDRVRAESVDELARVRPPRAIEAARTVATRRRKALSGTGVSQ